MLGETTRDRRAEQRSRTRAEIIEAAWTLARTYGLASITLRDVGRLVGMRAPSLYSYFESKHAIYDAMFAQGAQAFAEIERDHLPDDPVEALKAMVHLFVRFCTDDVARYQLLFQRTIPGFEPSATSFAISEQSLGRVAELLGHFGLTDPAAVDLYTALCTGLVDQQISNDPGGDRWIRLIDDAVEMFHAHISRKSKRRPASRSKGRRTA